MASPSSDLRSLTGGMKNMQLAELLRPSSSSSENNDALQGDGSPDESSPNESRNDGTDSSPLVSNAESRFFKSGAKRYQPPHERGYKSSDAGTDDGESRKTSDSFESNRKAFDSVVKKAERFDSNLQKFNRFDNLKTFDRFDSAKTIDRFDSAKTIDRFGPIDRFDGVRKGFGNNSNAPRRNNLSNYVPAGSGSYRNSRTWVSPDQQHMSEFLVVRNAMRRLFKNSDVAKWKYSDYIAHKEAMLASEKANLDRILKAKEGAVALQHVTMHSGHLATLNAFLPDPKNITMEGNSSRVLGMKTIWCPEWENGKDEISPWPTFAEFKWEGDDRAKTGVGRFPPLPRELGPPEIPWGQLQVVEQYPLDQVAKIPDMEDVYLPVDEIDDDVKYDLITHDLEDAMDAYLES